MIPRLADGQAGDGRDVKIEGIGHFRAVFEVFNPPSLGSRKSTARAHLHESAKSRIFLVGPLPQVTSELVLVHVSELLASRLLVVVIDLTHCVMSK